MPETNYWRTDRPADRDSHQPPADPVLPVRTVLPDHYEPGYAYPLVVLFHGRGGNEDLVLRFAPRLSTQNFIAVGIRGPQQLGTRPDGRPAAGWDYAEAATMLPEYVRLVVALTRASYHVHSERIYLAGVNEGAAAAYRAAFGLGDKVAGVIALNGGLPAVVPGRPNFALSAVRGLRVFAGHGATGADYTPAAAARDQRLLYAAGADVTAKRYPTAGKLHTRMFRDVNNWIIGNVNAEYESYQLK